MLMELTFQIRIFSYDYLFSFSKTLIRYPKVNIDSTASAEIPRF